MILISFYRGTFENTLRCLKVQHRDRNWKLFYPDRNFTHFRYKPLNLYFSHNSRKDPPVSRSCIHLSTASLHEPSANSEQTLRLKHKMKKEISFRARNDEMFALLNNIVNRIDIRRSESYVKDERNIVSMRYLYSTYA